MKIWLIITKTHYLYNIKKDFDLKKKKFIIFVSQFKMLNMEVKDLNRLKLVLVQKKRTAVWLAGELGVSPVTVSKWCSQKTQPDLKTLSRIAKLLEVDKRELLTED